MRRPLVLTNEAARHPFRRGLPPPGPLPAIKPEPMGDLQLFLLTFCAGLMAFYGFIS